MARQGMSSDLAMIADALEHAAEATREWIEFNRERAVEFRINEELQRQLYLLQIRKWEADVATAEANAAGAAAIREYVERNRDSESR